MSTGSEAHLDQGTTPRCAYCGVTLDRGMREEDHVIARGFFPEPVPTDDELIKVPACANCNRGSWIDGGRAMSQDEEYARSVLVMDWDAGRHPLAIQLAENEVSRALARRPHIAETFYSNLRVGDLTLRSGLVVSEVGKFDLDWPRVERVLEKIARGLFFHETGARLPEDHAVRIDVLRLAGAPTALKLIEPISNYLLQKLQADSSRHLGDGVFSYSFEPSPKTSPFAGGWLFVFYQAIFIFASIGPKELIQKEKAEQ
jgi:hypothetical protein